MISGIWNQSVKVLQFYYELSNVMWRTKTDIYIETQFDCRSLFALVLHSWSIIDDYAEDGGTGEV